MPTVRDNIVNKIKDYKSRGFEVSWNPLIDDDMIKVYMPRIPHKKIIVEGKKDLILSIQKEVEGN